MPFVVSGFLSVTIAILTVNYQAIRASSLDPVDTIRHQ
jgi:hypothetical protein